MGPLDLPDGEVLVTVLHHLPEDVCLPLVYFFDSPYYRFCCVLLTLFSLNVGDQIFARFFDTPNVMVIDDNPFGCVGYTTKAGETIAPIVRNREHYTAKVNFINGNVSLQSPTIAAFDASRRGPRQRDGRRGRPEQPRGDLLRPAAVPRPVGCVEALRPSPAPAARYAPASRDSYVTFTRKTVRISSREDDAIRTTVETWADAVPALA